MNPDRFKRVSALFREVTALEPGPREALLESTAQRDPELAAAVRRLLAAEADLPASLREEQLGSHAQRRALEALSAEPAAPSTVGPFEVDRILGVGGMGIVYKARRPGESWMALKVIRAGVMSAQAVRRFEHEAAVLASLEHEGIAQVHETGTTVTDEGPQPYFAMELVEGPTLLEYAQDRDLGTRDRMRLMSRICQAVQHAHLRGVIHRDLKPSNILVRPASMDGARHADLGHPKILDFGVARATSLERVASTMHTSTGQLLGTLPYMSPEQIEANPHDIDVRSDVYALGVLLYELLTGRHPFEVADVPMYELARRIREQEPRRPSTWDPALRGDLDTIILKALEKPRDRRYQSVAQLDADINHSLASEPIVARRGSTLYVSRKWLVRYRVPVTIAAVVLLALGTAITLRVRERGRAYQQALASMKLLGLESDEAITDPLKLAELTPSDKLQDAVAWADRWLTAQPELDARCRMTLGVRFHAQGMYDQAEAQLARSIERFRTVDDVSEAEVATGLEHLARAQFHNRHYDASADSYRESLQIRRRVLGANHADLALCHDGLAACLKEQARFDEAEPHYHRALAIRREQLGDDDVLVAASLNNLATLFQARGRFDEAEPLFREALERAEAAGVIAVYLARARRNVARCRLAQGDVEAAQRQVRTAMASLEAAGLSGHPDVASDRLLLARCALARGDLAAAEAGCTEALDDFEDPTGNVRLLLVDIHLESGRLDDAASRLDEALAVRRGLFPEQHPQVLSAIVRLAELRAAQDRLEESERFIERAVAGLRDTLSEAHPDVARATWVLGRTLAARGDLDRAEIQLQEAIRCATQRVPEGHWDVGRVRVTLARCLVAQQRFEPAEAQLLAAERGLTLNAARRRLELVTSGLVELYEGWDRPEQAATYLKRLEERPELHGPRS